jgi:formylglycine-generating enzyme required for sulfatase activity
MERTCKVGSYEPNGFGLYDMHGNVWEWCEDYYGLYRTLKSSIDPLQSEQQEATHRVLRGGSCYASGQGCRAAVRIRNDPWVHGNDYGFRVAAVVAPARP